VEFGFWHRQSRGFVVKGYLTSFRGEQLKARVVSGHAEPVLIADLQVFSSFIQSRLVSGGMDTFQLFVLARDQVLYY